MKDKELKLRKILIKELKQGILTKKQYKKEKKFYIKRQPK